MNWLLEITRENGDTTFNVLHKIEEHVYSEIKQSIDKVLEIENKVRFISSLKDEYDEYINCIEQNGSASEVLRRVNNYLNTYMSYINQWEKYVNKKDTVIKSYYKNAISSVYDKSFEYRFIYNLRNFASHGGEPISSINQSLERGTEIKLNRESFLKNYKKMQAPFREELKKIEDDNLDIDKAIKITQDNLLRFHQQMINRILLTPNHEYLKASVKILKFQKKYNKQGGEVAITSQESIEGIRKIATESSQHTISLMELPLVMAKTIIKGVHLKFKFKGVHMGTSPDLPYIESNSLLVEMPKFYDGRKYVTSDGIQWVRLFQNIGMNWKDGYGRYFALYMPEGLSTTEYMEEAKKYKAEEDRLFDRK
ncbi:hypothetical protein PQS34_03805 [Bacillus altitudinis]|uniref:hypothetical protein n=1 Tax=Bacillus altitudinis TaxID=293387 RepID=UPI00234DA5FA|nr:hypothetical protein [Bacillus altitudinis]MBW3700774.1 hypothetical protein [Bacillus aerophilus]MDC7795224.1 hypothetical protein [Bacillus altitudinis]